MDLPDYIKIPGAVLIAHGEIVHINVCTYDYISPGAKAKDRLTNHDGEAVEGERGWVIFVPEPPVTKGERDGRSDET